jgi:hypothetical protein
MPKRVRRVRPPAPPRRAPAAEDPADVGRDTYDSGQPRDGDRGVAPQVGVELDQEDRPGGSMYSAREHANL